MDKEEIVSELWKLIDRLTELSEAKERALKNQSDQVE